MTLSIKRQRAHPVENFDSTHIYSSELLKLIVLKNYYIYSKSTIHNSL